MSDLIRRSDALNALKTIGIAAIAGYSRIRAIPAVDAVEVRHGRWVKTLERKFINTNRHEEQFQKEVLGYGGRVIENLQCSECRMVTMVDASIMYDYCPHCGAHMDGEDGEA